MPRIATETLVHSLESLFEGGSVTGLSDRQLLERFNTARDVAGEAAFAALVARHGPMVLELCRQLMGDLHHAEDAFQAVFLVLARKAPTIRDPDLLANWLYGVALRTARYAKFQIDHRRVKEQADAMRHSGLGESAAIEVTVQPAIDRAQAEALHCEINRLPGSFRLPVVLCYFEGLTLDEAARRLNCPAGTLRSRLARARDKLRRGLTRRGVTLSAGTLAAALAPQKAAASVSSNLCECTTRAAIQFVAGQSAAPLVASLAREVLRSMFIHKLRLIAMTLLVLGAFATSAGYLTRSLARNDEPRSASATPDDAKSKPAAGRMFVVGRVLDPQGQPVPGAMVMAAARAKLSAGSVGVERLFPSAIGQVNADGFGRFQLDAPRTSSSRHDEFVAIALAPGYGAGWVKIDPDADRPAADISLQPEQVIRGHLFDVQGRPAEGVVVSVSMIHRNLVHDPGQPVRGRRSSEGPRFWWARVNDLPAWPKPATTNSNGLFTIHGVGRGFKIGINVSDPRFASQTIGVETDNAPGAKLVTTVLQPAKTFTGRVTYADTGKPVPHARLEVLATGEGQTGNKPTEFQTDGVGRFRANPSPGDRFTIRAAAPAGQLYLSASKSVDWPKGAIEQSLDLALPRGVTIRGKVVEEGSGHPVSGALVDFRSQIRPGDNSNDGFSEAVTGADGTFELAVPPGAGHLAVQAPTEDYVLREIGNREFFNGQPGGSRLYAHSFVACEAQPGGPGLEVRVTLRRGVTVTGRIVGPDGEPVRDVWIIGRATIEPGSVAWRTWRGLYHGTATGDRFELHGLDPDSDLPVYFLQPARRLAATAHFSGKLAAAEAKTVRLEACGTATARLVDAERKPIAGYGDDAMISMIITPGPDRPSRDPDDAKRLFGQSDRLFSIDPINYAKAPVADSQGRVVFPALIPGATYRVFERPAVRPSPGPPAHKDFSVKPGETVDLGDILIERRL